MANNGLYSITNSEGVTYEKSFYYSGGIRYLLEEWYTDDPSNQSITTNTYLYRRMTPYTEEDYAFTLGIKEKLKDAGLTTETYLCEGNPENTGFINPLNGQYEIGAFHAKRKETITEQVTQQLQYYVMQHNQYAGAYGITYDFTLPELSDTDWTNALSDITVIAFVQGIPILGQQYYNNYGLAGSNIVDKEFFIGYDDGTTPIYYSSRILDKTNAEFVKRLSMVDIFDYSKEAAKAGYYPDTQRNPSVLNDLIEDNVVIDANCIEYPDRVEINISKGTYIESVQYVKDVKGKGYFYDSNNDDYIIELPFDKIHYDADNNITITIYDICRGDDYSILIRDVDGRTKLITKEGEAPTFTVYFDDTTKEFVINAANLSYGINTGATIEHYYPGETTPSYPNINISSTSCTNYRITDGNNKAGTHKFKLIRKGDSKTKTGDATVTLYPDPSITATYDSATCKFTVTVNNLNYAGGTGGMLTYEYGGSEPPQTINENYKEVIIDSRYIGGTNNGSHKFTIRRGDGEVRSFNYLVTDAITIKATYIQSENRITVTASNLKGTSATVRWQAKSGSGTNLGSGTTTILSVSAGEGSCSFNPPTSCIPGHFIFTVTDGSGPRSATSENYTFYPIIRIGLFNYNVLAIADRKIRVQSQTVMGQPTSITYQKGSEDVESVDNVSNCYNSSTHILDTENKINFKKDDDLNKNISITITVNGIQLNYTVIYTSTSWKDKWDKWSTWEDFSNPNN